MHVFIDTNILLNFYHFTNDDLDTLNSVFVSHDLGVITVHVTSQVYDEFWRNREAKIQDALKRFYDLKLPEFPYFMKGYGEYTALRELFKKLKIKHDKLCQKAHTDIKDTNLRADHLIGGIFDKAHILEADESVYREAKMRIEYGNPPGKEGSLGDAINWLLLLRHVPDNADLYLITDDRDFYSVIDGEAINPFLDHEWRRTKKSEIMIFRNLQAFMKKHYDGVKVSLDPAKKELIDGLEHSGNFARTHAIVADLNSKYKYYSLDEARAILDAAYTNDQFGWIIEDWDITEFLRTAVLPHKDNLTRRHYREIIDRILESSEA